MEGWKVGGLAEARRQKSGDRSQKTEVRRQKTEDRRQKPEGRSQETEVRRQESEDRRQKSGGLVTHPHCQTSENKGFPSLYTLYLLFVFNPKS
jgi:hypothetical protein